MKYEKKQTNLQYVTSQRNYYRLITIGLLGLTLILSILLFRQNSRVILVPPTIEKPLWVESNKVSTDYLERMAVFIINQILDVSPDSAKYQRNLILPYVAPEFYGDFKSRLESEEKMMSLEQVTTSFSPKTILVDEKKLTVTVVGNLISFVGRERIDQDQKVYEMAFRQKDGVVLLTHFEKGK
jgi:conjugal transfer pilus assembly protein TraE